MKKQWLLDFINRNGPAFEEDISAKFGLSDSGVRSTLYRLKKQGLVRRLNERWMLTARGLARLDYLKEKEQGKAPRSRGWLDELFG